MIRDGVPPRDHRANVVRPLLGEYAFHEERRAHIASLEHIEQRLRVVGRTVIDRQPQFFLVRREVRHDRSEPLRVRTERWIEHEHVRQEEHADGEDRMRPEQHERNRCDGGKAEDQRANLAASSFAIEPRRKKTMTAASAFSATNAKNCHATKRSHDADVAYIAAANASIDIVMIPTRWMLFLFLRSRPTVQIGM